MIRTILAVSALLALTMGAASGQQAAKPFDAADYPPELRKSFDAAIEACREADDGKVTFAPNTVRRADLTGDGRPDYIVSLDEATCSTFESVFCGTGGCTHDIYVALADGSYRNVFSNRLLAYRIMPGKGASSIRFDLHGSYCDTYGVHPCARTRRITDKPFAFRNR
jgi:hypothetical protein